MGEHMKLHLEEPPQIRPCPDCDKKFLLKSELLLHRQKVHGEKKKVRQCEKCPRTFESKQYLAEHVQKYHEPTPCPRCGKKFPSRADAKAHFKEVHKRSKTSASSVSKTSPEKPTGAKKDEEKPKTLIQSPTVEKPKSKSMPTPTPTPTLKSATTSRPTSTTEPTPPKQPNEASELAVADLASEAQPTTANPADDDDVIIFNDLRIVFCNEKEKRAIEKIVWYNDQPKVSLYRLMAASDRVQAGNTIKLVSERNNISNDNNYSSVSNSKEAPSEAEKLELLVPKNEPGLLNDPIEEIFSSLAATSNATTTTTTSSAKRRSDSNVSSESKRSKTDSGASGDGESMTTTAATADVTDADSIVQFSNNEPRPLFIPNPYDLNLEAAILEPMSQDFANDIADESQSYSPQPSRTLSTSCAQETNGMDLVVSADAPSFKTPMIRFAKNLQMPGVDSIIDPTNISVTDARSQFFDELCQTAAAIPASSETPKDDSNVGTRTTDNNSMTSDQQQLPHTRGVQPPRVDRAVGF